VDLALNFATVVQNKVDKLKEIKELACICSKWTWRPQWDADL